MITNLIQSNGTLNTINTTTDNANNNFDRLIVRLERNFHYLQNNATRDRANGTPLDLSELNNVLIAGWERLALIRNQISINENNESNENLNNNDETSRNQTTNDDNNGMHVDGDRDLNLLGQPQPELNHQLPMPQLEYHDENLREYNDEFILGENEGGDAAQNYFREVGRLQQIEMNNRIGAQEMPVLPMQPLPQPIVNNNNNNNNNLVLEEHDDFEFVDSDSEDLINEETEDEDDASQGLISLSDLHVLELDGKHSFF